MRLADTAIPRDQTINARRACHGDKAVARQASGHFVVNAVSVAAIRGEFEIV